MPSTFRFQVTETDGRARRGEMQTAHGVVQTPAFMPVGTQGAVKAVTPRDLLDVGAEIILCNTYHLHLRPGDDRIARLGGLHRFTGWHGPILTDSGGYQVFSLASRRVLSEEGVRFRSHLDGQAHMLTPETAVEVQARLGSDIAMVLDECIAWPADRDQARRASERTHRWARRSRERFVALTGGHQTGDVVVSTPGQAQFGIVQGGAHPDVREWSARETVALDFEAYAIGGLGVGEPAPVMYDIVERTVPALPADRPGTSWVWGRRAISSSASRGGSICSTACSRPATPATASCSRGRVGSTSRTRRTPTTPGRPMKRARATPASTSPGPTCGTFFWLARSRGQPLTRCIICTFTLTRCVESERV